MLRIRRRPRGWTFVSRELLLIAEEFVAMIVVGAASESIWPIRRAFRITTSGILSTTIHAFWTASARVDTVSTVSEMSPICAFTAGNWDCIHVRAFCAHLVSWSKSLTRNFEAQTRPMRRPLVPQPMTATYSFVVDRLECECISVMKG